MTNEEFCRKQTSLIDEGRNVLYGFKNNQKGEIVVVARKNIENQVSYDSFKLDMEEVKHKKDLLIDIQEELIQDLESMAFELTAKAELTDLLSIVTAANFVWLKEEIIESVIIYKEQSIDLTEFFSKEYRKGDLCITQKEYEKSLLEHFTVISEDEKTMVIKFKG